MAKCKGCGKSVRNKLQLCKECERDIILRTEFEPNIHFYAATPEGGRFRLFFVLAYKKSVINAKTPSLPMNRFVLVHDEGGEYHIMYMKTIDDGGAQIFCASCGRGILIPRILMEEKTTLADFMRHLECGKVASRSIGLV